MQHQERILKKLIQNRALVMRDRRYEIIIDQTYKQLCGASKLEKNIKINNSLQIQGGP